MIERAGSSFQSLQGLQANRSFRSSEGNGSVFRQALAEELTEQQAVRPGADMRPSASAPGAEPTSQSWDVPAAEARPQRVQPKTVQPQWVAQLQPMINEVRQIAADHGYVGVSSQDVIRAYQTGQSFLADYHV